MKKYKTFIIGILAVTYLSCVGLSQQIYASDKTHAASGTEASGNLSIHLKIYKAGERKESIAFHAVNEETSFVVDHIPENEGRLNSRNFQGTLTPIDDQTYFLSYGLYQSIAVTVDDDGGTTRAYKDGGWNAEVELQKGEEVVLMKEDETVYTLTIGGPLEKPE